MKKNGFTLIELLAVIVIIGLLGLIVMPNVIDLLDSSRSQNFITETREVCKEATNTYIRTHILSMDQTYYTSISNSDKKLSFEGRSDFNYYVKVNEDGAVIGILTWDDDFVIKIVDSNGIEANDIDENDFVELNTDNMTLSKVESILSH